MLAPIVGKGESSRELNNWLKGIHQAREAAERKRLYYVACTRAREELHLFAAPDATTNGEVSREAGSLLGAAWPAAEKHFVEIPAPQTAVPFLPFPAPTEDDFIGEIAAAAMTRVPRLQRLPLGFMPMKRFEKTRLPYGDMGAAPAGIAFERPEGSFEARAFGNAVHGFLEAIAESLREEGGAADVLLDAVSGWEGRITAVLRSDGLSPASVERLVPRVITALTNTLLDPEGLWVLRSHEDAASEYALTSGTETRSSVRLDRVFRAGTVPLAEGSDCLWIVDYKTTTHGVEGVEEFLAKERAKYSAQMETYARVMKGATVGLYYPMLPRFIWWKSEG
jgi:ATP-dependent exoDNAse (exonuclease V) beta subunit